MACLLQIPCNSVLLDRNLPDLDATEVAEQIRRQYPQTAVELVDSRVVEGIVDEIQVQEQELSLCKAGEGDAAVLSEDAEPEPVHEGRSGRAVAGNDRNQSGNGTGLPAGADGGLPGHGHAHHGRDRRREGVGRWRYP